MKLKTLISPILLVIGLFLVASFSIRHASFHSGLMGILGCACLLGSLLVGHWDALQNGDIRTKRAVVWVSILLVLIVLLNIVESIL